MTPFRLAPVVRDLALHLPEHARRRGEETINAALRVDGLLSRAIAEIEHWQAEAARLGAENTRLRLTMEDTKE